MLAEPSGQPPGAGPSGGPGGGAAGSTPGRADDPRRGETRRGETRREDRWREDRWREDRWREDSWCEEPWWEPPEREPSDAELNGAFPDPFAGSPDFQTWLLSRDQAEADADDWAPDVDIVGAGFAEGGPADAMAPGPVLAALSADAVESGLGGLSDDALVGLLQTARRLSSWQAGVELAAVAELDARRRSEASRPGWSRTSEHVSAELAAALTLTGRSADELLGLARELARIPAVQAALLAGRIDSARARVFAVELAQLGDLAAAVVGVAFAGPGGPAGSMTTGQLRAALRAMVLAIDPDAVRRRAEAGRAEARVERWQEGSGNAGLAGRELPPAEAIAADARLTAIAKALRAAGAPGSLDALRTAVYTALLTGRDPETLLPAPSDSGLDHREPTDPGDPGEAGGAEPSHGSPARPGDPGGTGGTGDGGTDRLSAASLAGLTGSVHLVMPLSAWLGLTDAPGEVAGHGPADADTCRNLAVRLGAGSGTRWCLTLVGPDGRAAAHACARHGPSPPSSGAGPATGPGTGCAADVTGWLTSLRLSWLESGSCGHSRQTIGYRPGPQLAHLVTVRQRTCSFPGCRRPAGRCDLDHTLAYDQGGRTCECNLAPLCRAHHKAKQARGWQLAQPEPGTMVWAMPHGRSYTVTPDPYPA